MKPLALIIDDDPAIREALADRLESGSKSSDPHPLNRRRHIHHPEPDGLTHFEAGGPPTYFWRSMVWIRREAALFLVVIYR
jgi:hypothetical protein